MYPVFSHAIKSTLPRPIDALHDLIAIGFEFLPDCRMWLPCDKEEEAQE